MKLLDKNFLATDIWRACAPEHFDGMHIRGPMVIIEGDAELMAAL